MGLVEGVGAVLEGLLKEQGPLGPDLGEGELFLVWAEVLELKINNILNHHNVN